MCLNLLFSKIMKTKIMFRAAALAAAILLPAVCIGQSQVTTTLATIVSPAVNADLIRGRTYQIIWKTDEPVKAFKAKISITSPLAGYTGFTDPCLNITNVDTSLGNSFSWTVPSYEVSPEGVPFPDGVYRFDVVSLDDTVKVESNHSYFVNISSDKVARSQ
jgi:hypothetical protein